MKILKWFKKHAALTTLLVVVGLIGVAWAVDTKLSALTNLGAAPASTDEIYLNDAGTSKAITVDFLFDYIASSVGSYEVHDDNIPPDITQDEEILNPLASEPSTPALQKEYRADGITWDPAGLGINKSYKVIIGATGAELIDETNDRTFAGASNWADVDLASYDETTDLTLISSAVGQRCTLPKADAPMVQNTWYVLEFDASGISGSWEITDFDEGFSIGAVTANGTDQRLLFKYTDADTGGLSISATTTVSGVSFDNFSLKEATWMVQGDEDGNLYFSSIEIPNATDPDVDAEGEISHDTDGANETSDEVLRGYDGSAQFAWARKLHCIHVTVVKPNDLADATRDLFPIWTNETGMLFTVTKIEAWSDTDNSVVTINEYAQEDLSSAAEATEASIDTGTTGTSVSHVTITSIDNNDVQDNSILALDFDDTDDPEWYKLSICGWFNADID